MKAGTLLFVAILVAAASGTAIYSMSEPCGDSIVAWFDDYGCRKVLMMGFLLLTLVVIGIPYAWLGRRFDAAQDPERRLHRRR